MDKKISIIIPTRDCKDHLERCLLSIKSQMYQNYEVIVVDQNSTDGTADVAKKYGAVLISVERPPFYSPPAKSRNVGASHASGDIFYHLDSDMELSIHLLKEVTEVFQREEKIGALIIHEVDITHGFWSRVKALERKCFWGNDSIESARVVRKDIFMRVGGYDEEISSGEDFDIHRRYKNFCEIGFCRNYIYHNLGYINFPTLIRKKFNYGKTAKLYFKKNTTSGMNLLLGELECYLKNYKEFIRHPLLGICSLFLKFCEFGAGFVGMKVAK